jgi:hypothetical protein
VSECLKRGCRNLETTCSDCGRVVVRTNIVNMHQTQWISVKDKLPIEGVKVLTYLKDYDMYKIDYLILFPEPIWACVMEREQNVVTHWMPLPDSPND